MCAVMQTSELSLGENKTERRTKTIWVGKLGMTKILENDSVLFKQSHKDHIRLDESKDEFDVF